MRLFRMAMSYKKDIFGSFAYDFELLHKSRRSRCILSIPKELHIIKTKFCISSLRKKIQPTADDIRLRWWYTPSVMIYAFGDDIPLLSQWIKKRLVETSRFLAGVAGFEPTNAAVKVLCLTAWRHPNIKFLTKFYGTLARTVKLWGGRWDSNPRSPVPQTGALTN